MGRTKKGNPVHGWVNFDKPLGMTSTAAVAKLRWLLQAQKAGHAGTLDPLASGVLPIALGEATKCVPYMMDADKLYEFDIRFGVSTTTQDAEGAPTATSDVRPDDADILTILPQFIGEITQIPPKFSAIKVEGERAYDLARDGVAFDLKPRQVEVFDFRLVSRIDDDTLRFEVDCGKGVYIRALCRDLCTALGVEGHISHLRRLRVGAFDTSAIFGLEKLEELVHRGPPFVFLMGLDAALDDIPGLRVTAEETHRLKQGQAVLVLPDRLKTLNLAGFDPDTTVRAEGASGELIALCRFEGMRMKPVRVFLT